MKIYKGMKVVVVAALAVVFLITCGSAFAAQVTLELGTGTPKTHPQDQGALFLADVIEKGSNGAIEIKVYPSLFMD